MSLQDKINDTKKEITGERKALGLDGGKGSRPRSNFSRHFRDNYDSIFRRGVKAKPPLTSGTDQ
jgi:hypothetical protein